MSAKENKEEDIKPVDENQTVNDSENRTEENRIAENRIKENRNNEKERVVIKPRSLEIATRPAALAGWWPGVQNRNY